MAEILTYSSDKLTRLLARLKRKAGGRLSGIKRCEATLEKIREFFEDKGYLPKFYNPYNNAEITDITPTLTANCDRITNSATVLVFENSEKGSDNLTETLNLYDADEQADFTQTEAEEWAAEIALRIKEGNLDPIPKNKSKKFGQYDFTYASLFSGIGGFEQALNKFGGECVFSSEIATFAAQAYEALYSDKPAGDITKIDAKDIPDHDLLVGGFPCQAFSLAGKRKGFEDTRGTLFFDVARVAKEKQPKVVWIENVKGLVNHDKGRTLDVMIETLNEIGYTVDFEVLNSKYFGVPQNRERIFIIAIRSDLIEQEEWSEETTKGQTVVPRGKRRLMKYGWLKSFNFDWPEQAEVTTRLRDILEQEVDEKYYLDEEKTSKLIARLEAKHPDERMSRQAVEAFNSSNLPKEHGDIIQAYNKQHIKDGICPTLTTRPEGFKTASLPIVEAEPQMLGHVDIKGNDSIKRTYSTEGISPTLTTMGGGHREPKIAEEQEVRPRYRIRKLTPLECWRLQGFPDETHEAVKQAGISDSQRYKQAGNAVTVNVIEAIGERLIPLITKEDD